MSQLERRTKTDFPDNFDVTDPKHLGEVIEFDLVVCELELEVIKQGWETISAKEREARIAILTSDLQATEKLREAKLKLDSSPQPDLGSEHSEWIFACVWELCKSDIWKNSRLPISPEKRRVYLEYRNADEELTRLWAEHKDPNITGDLWDDHSKRLIKRDDEVRADFVRKYIL